MNKMDYLNILDKSVKDFCSIKFLTLSFAPLLIALMVFFIIMILGVSEVISIIQSSEDIKDVSLLSKILSFTVVHYILSSIFYIFGSFLVVIFSIFIAVLALGFFTPIVVKTLHQNYYKTYPLKSFGVSKSIFTMLIIFGKFILVFLLCIPFMLIPFVNIAIFNIPFFYLFYKLLTFDVASNIFDEKNYDLNIRPIKPKLIFISLIFYFLALIPILGLFLQLFFAIYLTHYIFSNLIK
ncbi:MAG: EI24 domain-containing protein [Campylobacteraceae bacterium]|jgi:hypothetical protein|nr:EI24 domain-containing protein [Campylobacteraceae bacterium]